MHLILKGHTFINHLSSTSVKLASVLVLKEHYKHIEIFSTALIYIIVGYPRHARVIASFTYQVKDAITRVYPTMNIYICLSVTQ